MMDKDDLKKKAVFHYKPKYFRKELFLLSGILIIPSLIISFFVVVNTLFFIEFPENITLYMVASLIAGSGISFFIVIFNKASIHYYVTSEMVFYTRLMNWKQIAMKKIAYVIMWNDGLEIAEKNKSTSSLKFLKETQKYFIPPITRRYKYILMVTSSKDVEELKLKNEILDYLLKQANLVKHNKWDFVYLSEY